MQNQTDSGVAVFSVTDAILSRGQMPLDLAALCAAERQMILHDAVPAGLMDELSSQGMAGLLFSEDQRIFNRAVKMEDRYGLVLIGRWKYLADGEGLTIITDHPGDSWTDARERNVIRTMASSELKSLRGILRRSVNAGRRVTQVVDLDDKEWPLNRNTAAEAGEFAPLFTDGLSGEHLNSFLHELQREGRGYIVISEELPTRGETHLGDFANAAHARSKEVPGAIIHRPVRIQTLGGRDRVVWRDESVGDEYVMWGSASG